MAVSNLLHPEALILSQSERLHYSLLKLTSLDLIGIQTAIWAELRVAERSVDAALSKRHTIIFADLRSGKRQSDRPELRSCFNRRPRNCRKNKGDNPNLLHTIPRTLPANSLDQSDGV